MAIKIGHASIDEQGKAKGGTAGDQTGKEVCIRTWYNKPWSLVIRATDSGVAEKMAKACQAGCANDHIGYDQNQRNTAHTQAKAVGYDLGKITTDCETDCSAFMTLCAIAAGVSELEYSGNAPTTSTMKSKFDATGKFEILTDSKYLTSDKYLKRGDILVKPGVHTVMALENGSEAGSGTSTTAATVKKTSTGKITTVAAIQQWLNDSYSAGLDVDDEYGPKTKKAIVKVVQSCIGTTADGIFGTKSKKAWVNVRSGSKGTQAKCVQMMLICRGFSCGSCGADGDFGSNSVAAVRSFQSALGLTVDGIVGKNTATRLFG